VNIGSESFAGSAIKAVVCWKKNVNETSVNEAS
jgi:hypothetical protein